MRKFIFTILISSCGFFHAKAANFFVTSLSGAWGDVSAGTLAKAIVDLHAAGAGPHRIIFQVAGTIDMQNPAQFYVNASVTGGVTFDGYTAVPGYAAGSPKIFLDGPGYNTFSIAASNVTFRGIGIFDQTLAVSGTNFKVFDCWFGLNSAGAKAGSIGSGGFFIDMNGANNSVIGFATNGYRNVFAGHGSVTSAISVTNSNSVSISGNYFGPDGGGLNLVDYFTGSSILLKGGTGSRVDSNVIGGCVVDKGGIEVNSNTNTGLLIRQNKIGVNNNGVFFGGAVTSNMGNKGHGILFYGGSANNAQITNNVISANGQSGIQIVITTSGVNVSNNIIGLPATGIQGAQNYGNGFAGVLFKGGSTSNLTIDNNTVCKNGWRSASPSFQDETVGIILSGTTVPAAATVTISNNYVGVDRSFNLAGNIFTGIYLFQNGNMSGGVKANVQITNNVTGDNGETPGTVVNSHGIAVYNSSAFTITSNYIGVGPGGQNIGNSANGIEINTASNFTFTNNQVAYNKGRRTSSDAEACAGVMLFTASNGYVQNNNVYSNTNAGAGFVNNHGVVAQRGGGLLIGGTGAGEPNNISNNGTHGVFVLDGADNVEIRRNVIACNNSMGISLNIAGDPDTEGSKGVGNSSYGVAEGPTLATTGCPGAGSPGSGNANGAAPANSLVEVFETPACKTCTTGAGSKRGEALSYQQQVTATGASTWSATGVVGTVSVTATSSTTAAVGGNNFRKTSRFSTCEVCSLPIELLFFQAKRNGEVVLLTWATATEENNKFFTIERSENGKDFYPIGVVEGAGNSSAVLQYSFTDQQPLFTGAYYRLRQQDIDGQQSLSSIAYVAAKDLVSISVFPNPAQSQVTVVLPASGGEYGNVVVRLYNVLGQELLSVATSPETLSTGVVLDLSSVPAGTYTLKVANAQQDWVEQLVKK